jgi:hypothetical protein
VNPGNAAVFAAGTFLCDMKVDRPSHVGQDGILRRVGNPPAGLLQATCWKLAAFGRLTIGRRLPACPTRRRKIVAARQKTKM